MLILKTVIFVLATAGIVYVSRSSLLDPRSHGFYRAFAWEAIVILILLNLDVWFRDPFSWHQIISWFLLLVCLFPLIAGVHSLRSIGKPEAQRNDVHLIGIEKTTALVTGGAYRYIRHPIYSAGFIAAWGVFFKVPSWPGGLLALAATLFLLATAKVEESENIRYFGLTYAEYRKRTKMFIPFVF
jgi:protein-S-isoprenylcysteine O-methyltransferase Ste14